MKRNLSVFPKGFEFPRIIFCRSFGRGVHEQDYFQRSVCLLKKYQGGSRNGLIVLAQHTDRQDADYGSQYTVKEYHSAKYQDEEKWHHQAITLTPKSNDPSCLSSELLSMLI